VKLLVRSTKGTDEADYRMALEYLNLARRDVFTVEAEIVRLRTAADRLVRVPSVQRSTRRIASALLGLHGTLSGDEIVMIAADRLYIF
jgi:hypothetical protein